MRTRSHTPQSISEPDPRHCEWCGLVIPRDPRVSDVGYARRKFCCQSHVGLAMRRHPVCPRCGIRMRSGPEVHRCPVASPQRAPGFPGASIATWAALPARCPRCGGPWRLIPGGVQCVLCARAFYVGEGLAAAERRLG